MLKLLEQPDENGYSLTENQNALLVAALDGGADRMRLDFVDGSRFVNLQWSGRPERFKRVRDFFNDNLGLNCEPFLIDLIIASADYQEYTCNIVPDSIRTLQPAGINWSISATFEVGTGVESAVFPFALVDCDNAYTEDFTIANWANYGAFTFDPVAKSIHLPGGPIDAISTTAVRTINLTAVPRFQFDINIDFRPTTGLPDDGPVIILKQGSFRAASFDSVREKFFDSLQRPMVSCDDGATQTLIGTKALDLNKTYTVIFDRVSTILASVTIVEKNSGLEFGSAEVPTLLNPWNFSDLLFQDTGTSGGGSDTRPGGTYSNVVFC